MTHAYTPGLKVSRQTEVRKERRLPLKGDVLVGIGDRVTAETIVAKTELPGNVQTVNVANRLSILPEDIERSMLVKVGDWVDEGKLIAQSRSFFGLFKSSCKMPASGTIESVSNITGQVIIREKAIPVEVDAYVDGEVVEVFEDEGVMVKTTATFVQGIFGIGGEAHGESRGGAEALKPLFSFKLFIYRCLSCLTARDVVWRCRRIRFTARGAGQRYVTPRLLRGLRGRAWSSTSGTRWTSLGPSPWCSGLLSWRLWLPSRTG